MDVDALKKAVSQERDLMVESLCGMLRINAVGPESGGPGEAERGKYLVVLARKLGFESIEVIESSDPKVPTGKRPNIIIRFPGTGKKRVWVVTHMDTVPEGDMSAWKYPPFDPKVVGGKIYGRGAEDNGQELMASLFGAYALLKAGIRPELNVGLVFVSDEEYGNAHGIDLLLKKDIFRKGDLVVVPDHGQPDGAAISIVEKSSAWIQVEVIGRQTHASTPDKGVNALEAASRYIVLSVERLRKKFTTKDPLFEPPVSTFAPTRCEANGPNINTIPGRQVFAFDFRVLPEHSLDDIMKELQKAAREIERSTGAKVKPTFLQRSDAAPKTPLDSEVVKRMMTAVESVRGAKPHPIGIGGGTCAAPFRRKGIEAAVWSTIPETAHDANEYANVADLVNDAQVYAVLFAGKNLD